VDFRRLFLDQLPLGTLQLDYARDAGIEAGITARVEREYFIDPFHSTNLWENGGSGNPVALENDFISRGFLWYDFHPLQIELGRDMVQVGPGSHSLLPSLDLPYLDMLRVRLPVGRLTGDLIVSTLENRKRGYDVSPVPTEPQFGSTIILMAMHRFEYSFDSLRLGAGALAVYARNGNAYDLGDIFPVFSWHQADIGTNHLSVVLDASWTPFAGLLVQGQFGLQSLNLSDLGGQLGVNLGENQPAPTVGAGIASAQYSVSLGGSMDLLFLAEGGSTHYLWGNFSPDPEGYPDVLARGIDRSYLEDRKSVV
jgi:hypothetical protein